MQLTIKALVGILTTISAATAVSFDMENLGAEKRGVSGEELHMLHGNEVLARFANGVYPEVANGTRVSKRAGGAEVDLTSVGGGTAWAVKAKIGSNEEEVTMLLDSGYEHALVAADSDYSPGKSSSNENTGEKFFAGFLTGGGNEGTIHLDDLSVGGLKASKFAFGYTKNRDFSGNQKLGGILGMSLPGHVDYVPGFKNHGWGGLIQTLKSQGVIDEAMYQMTLKGDGGKLSIGEVDDSQYEGDLETLTNTGKAYGHCGFKGTLNGEKHNFLLDSGTMGIAGSYDSVKKFLQGMSGVELVEEDKRGSVTGKVDCDSMPSFKISVDGKFDVKLSDDVMKKYDLGNGKCMLPIYGYTNMPNSYSYNWIVGGAFMREVSVVCKFDSNEMQIARQ